MPSHHPDSLLGTQIPAFDRSGGHRATFCSACTVRGRFDVYDVKLRAVAYGIYRARSARAGNPDDIAEHGKCARGIDTTVHPIASHGDA